MDFDIIEELWSVIEGRKASPKKGSYTNQLLNDEKLIFKKLKEELSEIEEAAKKGHIRGGKGEGKDSLVWEASDFIYHLLVLLAAKGVKLDEVLSELKRRR